MQPLVSLPEPGGSPQPATQAIAAKQVPPALLERLIREVQNDAQPGVAAYNRMHNRHNRGR